MTRQLLRSNDYPEPVIEKIAEKSRNTTRRQAPYMQQDAALLKVPFRNENIQQKVKKIVQRSGFPVNIVFEHTPNLKDTLVRSALRPRSCCITQEREKRRLERRPGRPLSPCLSCKSGLPPHLCDEAGVVYMITCVYCQQRYIGETYRVPRERFEEHHYEARYKVAGKPWGEHFAKAHPDHRSQKTTDVIFIQARILAFERRTARRKIREAVEIRERRPEINLAYGWPLAPSR